MIEIACFSVEAVRLAESSGADRVEFCADYSAGGTTPRLEDVIALGGGRSIPMYTMIRPRSGDFNCSEAEFSQMAGQVERFKSFVDGLVFGILQPDGTVDVARNTQLVRLASPLPCTFHRAFDETPDLMAALEDVIACGFSSILSSGGAETALNGAETLGKMVASAADANGVARIQIMPVGGIRAGTIAAIRRLTGATWYHSAALVGNSLLPSSDQIAALKTLSAGERTDRRDG